MLLLIIFCCGSQCSSTLSKTCIDFFFFFFLMCGYVSDKNSYIMIAVKHDPYRRVGKTELCAQYGLRGVCGGKLENKHIRVKKKR